MLKKLSVVLCISSLLGAGVAMADSGSAQGSIIFKGKVSHDAPLIVVKRGTSGTGDALTTNPEIQLGTYTAAELDKRTEFYVTKSQKFRVVIQRPSGTNYNHIDYATLQLTASVNNGVITNDYETGTPPADVTAANNVGVALRYFGTTGYGESTNTGMAVFASTGSATFVGPDSDANGVRDTAGESAAIFNYAEVDPEFYFAAALQQIDTNKNIGGGDVKSTLTVVVSYQ